MANRGVVYKGPGKVAVEAIPDPKFETDVSASSETRRYR